MHSDLSSGGSPRRLIRREGRWSLEVVRMVSAGGGVFRPEVQRLDGVELISSFFKRNPQNDALARGASELLAAQRGPQPTQYAVSGGEWVLAKHGQPLPDGTEKARSRAHARVARMHAELVVLRVAYAQLQERLHQLELLSDAMTADLRG